jgi:hypothetical protein
VLVLHAADLIETTPELFDAHRSPYLYPFSYPYPYP